MKHTFLFLVLFIGLYLPAFSQKAAAGEITLEDIWASAKLYPKSVPGFNFMKNGKLFTRLEEGSIFSYDLLSGNRAETLFSAKSVTNAKGIDLSQVDDYSFSDDEQKLILAAASEGIYRHSTKANYVIFDRQTAEITPIAPDKPKQRYATFSPQSDKVAYELENDLYIFDQKSGNTTRVTSDGKINSIINGASDWVYEEEFVLVRAFEWSPDGRYLAFLRFDESAVREFTLEYHTNQMYPVPYTFKYPKVGEKNAVVTAHVFDLTTGKTQVLQSGAGEDDYLPRIKWTPSGKICLTWMNRHQNHLKLLLCEPQTGASTVLLEEKNKYYVELTEPVFLKNSPEFVWLSEESGKNSAYLYAMTGKKIGQIADPKVEITDFYGVDEANGTIYYQGVGENPAYRELYASTFSGKKTRTERLSTGKRGTYSASFSTTFDYYMRTYSDMATPATYEICDRNGKVVRLLENNAALIKRMEALTISAPEYFDFTTDYKVTLNGWMIKPQNPAEPNKKYPVLMYVYGGPGSQETNDAWQGPNYWWFQMMAQKGYIVACVDNRGTGGRGEEFKKMTYLQLGKYETEDQIAAAKYLSSLPYVDASRIGIFGWSYGGFMASHCITQGAEVFKAAIAVAPVTNWKWYDSIYTERYMRTHSENQAGYDENSPVTYADKLKGNYLLVHGLGDDNVHAQNAIEMADRLIAANKPFEMMFYPNKNHGIYGGYTRLHLYTLMTDFLMRKL